MPLVDTGRKAPAFNATDQDGASHRLRDFSGRPVVLYFYPKDDTSGCTKEACAFRDLQADFSKVDAVVLGVSPDDGRSHRRFVDKHDLNFTLLADVAPEGGEPPICAAYGTWQQKSMYGRTYMGVVRTTYLIDGDGKVARRWDKVKVPGHAEEVLAAAQELRSS